MQFFPFTIKVCSMVTEVNLNIVENWLVELFGSRPISQFNFSPADLLGWSKLSEVNIVTTVIPRWDEFEEGAIEWGAEDFKSIVWDQAQNCPEDPSIFFVSDDVLKTKTAFEFKFKDFDEFVEFYEARFTTSFFQPLDYLICLKECGEIIIIYHEGKKISINKS